MTSSYSKDQLHKASKNCTSVLTNARHGILGKRLLFVHVFLSCDIDCSFAIQIPEGPRIHSANGVRHRQYTFRRVYLFASEWRRVRFHISLFADFSLWWESWRKRQSQPRARRWCRSSFQRYSVACKNNPAGGMPINFLKAQAEKYGFLSQSRHLRV